MRENYTQHKGPLPADRRVFTKKIYKPRRERLQVKYTKICYLSYGVLWPGRVVEVSRSKASIYQSVFKWYENLTFLVRENFKK